MKIFRVFHFFCVALFIGLSPIGICNANDNDWDYSRFSEEQEMSLANAENRNSINWNPFLVGTIGFYTREA